MSTPSILSAIQKLRSFLSRKEKFKWLGIIGFALCTSSLEVLTASVVVIFAQVLNQPEMGEKYLVLLGFSADLSLPRIVFYISIIVGIVYLIKNIVSGIEIFYQNFAIQKMNYDFKNKLLYRYAEAGYRFYLTRNSSLSFQTIGGDVEYVFSTGMISLASVLSEAVVFLSIVGFVVIMNPILAFAVFGIGLIFWIGITKILLPQFYLFGQKLREASLNGNQNLMQFFHGFKEIVLFGKRDSFVNAYQYHSRIKSHIQATQTAINVLPRIVIEILFMAFFVATISLLCLKHESPLKMMGVLSGYLYAGFRLMPGLNRLINQLNVFKSTIPSIERVYMEYNTVISQEDYVEVPELVFEKSIVLRAVNFLYAGAKEDALVDISLEIKKGECIGIVGETGSGKSTLVDIILGLLKPHKGAVLVDAKFPVNSYQWHLKLGYVPQSVYLVDDTIEANIAFGEKRVDQQKLNNAINAAQLRKCIEQLPLGSQTIVGERGIRLSGGERQRIAIARALYRDPEVLIFDEATSALDNETESRLMETIDTVRKNRTVIMIAHRLTSLKGCDRIVVMENRKIKELIRYSSLGDLSENQSACI